MDDLPRSALQDAVKRKAEAEMKTAMAADAGLGVALWQVSERVYQHLDEDERRTAAMEGIAEYAARFASRDRRHSSNSKWQLPLKALARRRKSARSLGRSIDFNSCDKVRSVLGRLFNVPAQAGARRCPSVNGKTSA